MKKPNLSDQLFAGLKTAVQYWSEHAASQRAMDHVYERKWREDDTEAEYKVQVLINPEGSIFKVTHRHFVNGDFLREEEYPATYGYFSNGNLCGLGLQRYLIFDTAKKQLLVEDWNDVTGYNLTTYEQI